jgi:hypothetical protein
MIPRGSAGPVFALSRIDAAARTEYLVAFNSADEEADITVETATPGAVWRPLLGAGGAVDAGDGRVRIVVPARSSVVVRSDRLLPQPSAPKVALRTAKDSLTGRYRLTATVPGQDPSSVTFLVRRPKGAWQVAGVDDARPYRLYLPTGKGTVQVAAVVTDSAGQSSTSAPRTIRIDPFL